MVAAGSLGDMHPANGPHHGGGGPHGRASTEEEDYWACPIVEEPILDDFK